MEQKGLDFGGGAPAPGPARRRAMTVSELTNRLQGVLETEFFDVWVEGEVSNLTIASSGHWYFSLKDGNAQVSAVVWKTATRLVKFKPKDGMKVLARGSLKVYPPKGAYQVSVEVLEPIGKGSLQQAYEDLKEKLEKEGLFDKARKRPLPMLPRRVGIVTSPTGAVIQDILRVVGRRYANLEIAIYPARVQGEEAVAEIIRGIRALNACRRLRRADRGPRRRQPGGPLGRSTTSGWRGRWPRRRSRPSRPSGTRPTSRSPTSWPTCARPRLRRRRSAWSTPRTRSARSSTGCGAAPIPGSACASRALRSRVGAVTQHRVFEAERGRLRDSRAARRRPRAPGGAGAAAPRRARARIAPPRAGAARGLPLGAPDRDPAGAGRESRSPARRRGARAHRRP